MARRSRECYLCGTGYKYCGSCSQDKMKPSWMSEFHSESCKNIFDICTRFNLGMISKIEAQDELKSCDLTNKENFKSYVKHDLEVIFAEDPVVVTLEAEIKEVSQDKAIVETRIKGSKKKQQHEVILEENE